MYSGKIAVPPGGGGIQDNLRPGNNLCSLMSWIKFIFTKFDRIEVIYVVDFRKRQ
jgi:hypothetical protein